MFENFNIQEFLSATIVLFAVIDIIGAIPIIIDIKQSGRSINAATATICSLALMLAFFFAGDLILRLFNVDIASFAAAGAIIIFIMAFEMILDVEIFNFKGAIKSATFVPLVFPLLAGAGSFTTLLSLKAEYADVNIILALILNMAFAYVVIKLTKFAQMILGAGGVYILRKFFGIILLAIAVKLFTTNFAQLWGV